MSIPTALRRAAVRPRPPVTPAELTPVRPIDLARTAVRASLADAVPDGWLVLYGSHDTDRASIVVRPAEGDAPAVHVTLTDATRWSRPGVVALDVSRRGRSVYGEHPGDVVGDRATVTVLSLLLKSS